MASLQVQPEAAQPAKISALPASWAGQDVLSTSQFDEAALELLFQVADGVKAAFRSGRIVKVLEGKLLACVFMEPSTRTSCSFLAAVQRLGGTAIMVTEQGSSAKKGESLEDTVRCLECYADALVLRHPETGSAARAAQACRKPVLNAGDGVGEHPTQALLDLYTIRCELWAQCQARVASALGAAAAASASFAANAIEGVDPATVPSVRQLVAGKVVTLVGDLKHGRTVHSLAHLLGATYGRAVELCLVAPPQLPMPPRVLEGLAAHGCRYAEHSELSAEVLRRADVVYVTRVQKERFASVDEYEALKLKYVVTPATLAQCQPSLVLMHPLPRVGEIDPACDSDPRAAYFRQMEAGLHVRAALLALVLGADLSSLL